MTKEILIYALGKGVVDRYMETLISTQCKTQSDIDNIKTRASGDGFHSFRITNFIPDTVPEFIKIMSK